MKPLRIENLETRRFKLKDMSRLKQFLGTVPDQSASNTAVSQQTEAVDRAMKYTGVKSLKRTDTLENILTNYFDEPDKGSHLS